MLEPKDDLRHPLVASPHARESLFYNVLLPEHELMVFVYTWVNSAGEAGHLVTVVGQDNTRHAVSAIDGVPVGGADFDDWRVGGLRLRHTDPMRRLDFSFTGGDDTDLTLEAEFRATHAAFDYAQNADGCPAIIADNRFEQSGHLTGRLTLGGRTIEFDTTGHRDHSWGDRDWDSIQDWKWVSAQAGDDLALNVMVMHARGETTRHGYVLADGVLSAVRDVRTRAEYDEHWWQTALDMTVCDADGRETTLDARRYALLAFEAGERMALHEAGCRGSINGRDALVHVECGWDRHYAASQARRVAGENGSAG
jgi:hypothetical protein